MLFPFDKIGLSAQVRECGAVFSEEYTEAGLLMDCLIDTVTAERLRDFQKQ